MKNSKMACNYLLIDKDEIITNKIINSLDQGRFTCIGKSHSSQHLKSLGALEFSPDIIIMGSSAENQREIDLLHQKYPQSGIIIAINKGEEIDANLLGVSKVSFIQI
ncbi:hypothetical protein [Echinicola pacifica]|uniref:hypothetical protein n=1 Tax=Echinicola pacifica TaxID=346377 RepID=UPI0003688D5F|nr:hypothetical protein [Echinicola pacifica]